MPEQSDPAANPIGTTLVFEDDRVRIWRIEIEPGEVAPFHTHELDYTTVSIEGDIIERMNGDGSIDRIAVQPGNFSRWYQSTQQHSLKNVGTRRFRNVIIELKNRPANFEEAPRRRAQS